MPMSILRLSLGLFAIGVAPLASAANLLVNPGFEAGLAGWTTSGNAAIRTADPPAFEGTNYVFGANTPLNFLHERSKVSPTNIRRDHNTSLAVLTANLICTNREFYRRDFL